MFRSAFTNTFRSLRASEVARTFVCFASKNQLPKLAVSKHPEVALMKARSSESLRITKHSIAASARFMSTVAEGKSLDKSKLYKASVPEIQNHQEREVLKYPDGFVYEGEMSSSLPHGQEKITLRDGKVFEGEFVNGVLQGQPRTLTTPWYSYEGDVLDGKPHGQGKMTLKNGEVWEGEFCESKLHGKAKTTHPDGQVVEGEFKNSIANGFCVVHRTNGVRVEGHFVNNYGIRIMKSYFPDGEIQEAYYVKGEAVGPVRRVLPDGVIAEGEYLSVESRLFMVNSLQLRHGWFQYTHPCGLVQEGRIHYDIPVGRWTFVEPSGEKTTEEMGQTIVKRVRLAFMPYKVALVAMSWKEIMVEGFVFTLSTCVVYTVGPKVFHFFF